MTQDVRARIEGGLQERGITYEVFEHEPLQTMQDVRDQLDLPPWAMVKTMVVRRRKEAGSFWLIGIPHDARLDMKAVAASVGSSRSSLEMVPPSDVEACTGMTPGALGLLSLEAPVGVILDRNFHRSDYVCFGSGDHRATLRLTLEELKRAIAIDWFDNDATGVARGES